MHSTDAVHVDLPPMTFQGALVLGGGVLRPASLSVASGRIVAAGGADVDLSGFALLPGALDMGGALDGEAPSSDAVARLAGQAVRAGTTSLWIGVDWPERHGGLEIVRESLQRLADLQKGLPVDLGVRFRVGTHAVETAAALVQTLAGLSAPLVVFQHPPDRERIAAEAEFGGVGPIARHLCRLASAFDGLGLRYATEADPDGEHRERFSMIGARLALRPKARGAAASARAMGEPVVLAAADILEGDRIGRSLAAMLLSEGLCDALGAFGAPCGPLEVVRRLVERELLPLGHAWALVSAGPAGILRRSDRGALVAGTRADIAVMDAETREIAGTIAGGVLVHGTTRLLDRLRPTLERHGIAAE